MESPSVIHKRLAVFLDGTWNTQNDSTNVWRLKALCAPRSTDGWQQRTYYDIGVGNTQGEKVRGGAYGFGLDDNIVEAYLWLIDNYDTGDEIFILGFSRGAYTARALSGLLSKSGLLRPGAPLSLKQLYDRYRRGGAARTIRALLEDQTNKSGAPPDLEEQWLLEHSQLVEVKFMGVFDTVGSLGIPNVPWLNKRAQFLNTGLRTSNNYAFHAVAIDEHRGAFLPTLWTKDVPYGPTPLGVVPPRPIDKTEQRWFVGAHGNVGGGYYNDLLAQIPLRWMMEKAKLAGLAFRRDVMISGNVNEATVGDSFAEFAYGFYQFVSRRHYREIGGKPLSLDGGKILRHSINETIDASVFERYRQNPQYRPSGLERWATMFKLDPGNIRNSVRADEPNTVVA